MNDLTIQTNAPLTAVERSDKLWLADRIAAIEHGVESTAEVAANWTQGRNLSKYFPGQNWYDYVRAQMKAANRAAVLPLLTGTDWSNKKIAAHVGVDPMTVAYIAREQNDSLPERPEKLLGRDGKYQAARHVRTVTAEILEPDVPAAAEHEAEYVPREPGAWNAVWTRLVEAALELDKDLNRRQLIVADHTYAEWERIDEQVNIVIRTLEMFQRREKAALAATSR